MSFGKGTFIGRLAKDCELQYSQDGKAVLKNAIAYDRYSASAQKRETNYINFLATGKTAENIQKYFSKGSLIYLAGDIEQIRWTDKTSGQNRSLHQLLVKEFDFCGGSGQKQQTQYQQPQQQTIPQAQQPVQPETFDDVPF